MRLGQRGAVSTYPGPSHHGNWKCLKFLSQEMHPMTIRNGHGECAQHPTLLSVLPRTASGRRARCPLLPSRHHAGADVVCRREYVLQHGADGARGQGSKGFQPKILYRSFIRYFIKKFRFLGGLTIFSKPEIWGCFYKAKTLIKQAKIAKTLKKA